MTDAISAAKKGDVVFLRDYLQNCTEKEITDNHGFTLFHWAAQFNHVPVLELLKDCGVDVGKATDSGDTALHLATSFERKEAITKLLEWDLDVNCTNEHGNTPLHYACLWRNMEIAERLLRHGSQLRPLNKYGKEPLDFCDREQKEMLTELAKSFNTGLEVVPYKDEHHHGRELISYKFVKLEIPPGAVKIKDRISKGTYSDTFTGIWKERKVAVRRLRWSEKMSEKVINDWLQEAGRLWKMEDPVNSVLSIVGVIRLEGGWSIVSQHIPRGSLEEVLADSQLHLKVEQKYRMAHGIAKGLQYLHSLEDPLPYLRLNLKMCLVDSKFNVLLNVASAGFTFNTAFFPITHEPAYVAPEVLKQMGVQDSSADVYSFGVILNRLFSPAEPFQGLPALVIGTMVLNSDIRPKIEADTPSHINKLIRLCWDKDVDARPPISEVCKIFQKLLSG